MSLGVCEDGENILEKDAGLRKVGELAQRVLELYLKTGEFGGGGGMGGGESSLGGMAVALESRIWLAGGWVGCSAGGLLREVGGGGGVDRMCRVLRRVVGGRRGHYEGRKRTDGRDSWLMWVGVSCSKAALLRSKRKKIMGRDGGTGRVCAMPDSALSR